MIKVFILTIFMCSGSLNDCRIVENDLQFNSYYNCMQYAQNRTYDMMYNTQVTEEQINKLLIYPKWICIETEKQGA